jgi:hypothetical protein
MMVVAEPQRLGKCFPVNPCTDHGSRPPSMLFVASPKELTPCEMLNDPIAQDLMRSDGISGPDVLAACTQLVISRD